MYSIAVPEKAMHYMINGAIVHFNYVVELFTDLRITTSELFYPCDYFLSYKLYHFS